MSSYEIRFNPSNPAAGFSENSISVFRVMITASSGSTTTALKAMICGCMNGNPCLIGTESFCIIGKSISPLIA